jgi:hypothetical protein
MTIITPTGVTGINSITASGNSLSFQNASGASIDVSGLKVAADSMNVSGIVTASRLNVGTGGTIISTTVNGSVGIGTTNPTKTLTVFATSNSTINIDGSTQTRLNLNTSSANKHWSITNEANAQRLRIGVADDANDTNFVYAAIITESGNVGIRTDNTNSRQLSVYGPGINGTQIEARGTGGNSAGLSMYSGKNYEIQSTSTTEASYPSSFLVYDRDNNGYRLIVDGSGRVMKPAQPGFFASGSAGSQNQPGTGDADDLGPRFNTTSQAGGFNVGNHYSTSTGVFTAPVSGKYYTFFNMRWETGSFIQNNYIRIHISINNNNNLFIHQINGQNEAWTSYMAMSCSGVVSLSAGDTLRPKGGMSGGTAVGWWNESSWGAWLLG